MNKYHTGGQNEDPSSDMVQAGYFPGSNLFVDLANYPDLKAGAEVEIRNGRGVVRAIKGDKAEIILETLDVEVEKEAVKTLDDPYGVDHEDDEEDY